MLSKGRQVFDKILKFFFSSSLLPYFLPLRRRAELNTFQKGRGDGRVGLFL